MRKNNPVVLSIFKGVLSLSIIALVCTVLLGAVNIVTYIDPLQAAYDNFAKYSTGKQYTSMLEENWQGSNAKILYYAQSTDGSSNAFLAEGKGGYGGPVEVYVIVNVATKKIEKVELGSHSETFIPNLNKAHYFEQFLNKDITQLNGGDIDAVAGATLSSSAITNAVLAISEYYTANPTKVADQTQNAGGGSGGQNPITYSAKSVLQQTVAAKHILEGVYIQHLPETRQGGAF